ncbi:nucleoside 2-deoxyribosyltransferase [Candidatus Neomarinimicrobiota bacterium]
MRIYFAGSMSGGRQQAYLYPRLIEELKQYGEVLTEFVGNLGFTRMGERDTTPEAIYQRDVDFIKSCDVMVADVTVPSLGVGVETALASMHGKSILALYQPGEGRKLSAMIAGNPHVTVAEYQSPEEATAAIGRYFETMASSSSSK